MLDYEGMLAVMLGGLVLSLRSWSRFTPATVVGPITLAIVYGGAKELYQTTVPGRDPSWLDVGVNSAGAVAGVGGGYLMKRVVPRWVGTRALTP